MMEASSAPGTSVILASHVPNNRFVSVVVKEQKRGN